MNSLPPELGLRVIEQAPAPHIDDSSESDYLENEDGSGVEV